MGVRVTRQSVNVICSDNIEIIQLTKTGMEKGVKMAGSPVIALCIKSERQRKEFKAKESNSRHINIFQAAE